MLQTLFDVLGQKDRLLAEMIEKSGAGTDFEYFNSTEMDGVVVLGDEIAKRFLEHNYTLDTHIAPHRLPGTGLSVSDILTHEGRTYLTLNLLVMISNVTALHLMRQHDETYVKWSEQRDATNERVRRLIEQLRLINDDCFGFDEFKRFEELTSPVGWSDVGTPSPEFIKATSDLAKLLMRRRKKGMRSLARTASVIADELAPYSIFREFMQTLRKDTGHKRFPLVHDGMLTFSTPAASGNATMHTHNPSDDVNDAMPSTNDLFVIAMQSGRFQNMTHFGSGSVPGEHYWMLPPRSPYFPEVQKRVDDDPELNRLWTELSRFDGDRAQALKQASVWTRATLGVKSEVAKSVVPDLIGQRVLGFHVDMNTRSGTALLRPVVAEAHYQAHADIVKANGLEVIKPPFFALLAEDNQGYGELPSIFGQMMPNASESQDA